MGVIHVDFGDDLLEEAVESHPAGKGVPERERALLEVRKWSMRIDIAREGYSKALGECRELGLGNTVIARAAGKSEAAIRMHFGRRKR